MARVPVLAIALLFASVGVAGFAYLRTRPETVVHVDRVAQAVASTSSAKSFTFTYSTTISTAGNSLTMSGNGSFDGRHELVAMKMHFDGLPPGSPAAGANAEVVLDNSAGLVEYIHVALLDGHLPAGKSWVKVDVGELGKKAGIDLSRLQQGDSADPSRIFSLLRRSANPTVVGQENVGGVATTHYEATVDLRRLAALETNAAVREALQRAIAETGINSYPVEVWIDGDRHLRRMRTTIPQHLPESSTEVATVTATEELSNFGTEVRIAVPPDESVVDISELAG